MTNCFYVDGVNEHSITLIKTNQGLVSKIGDEDDFWILNISFSNVREAFMTSSLSKNGDTKIRFKMFGGSFEEFVFEDEEKAKVFLNEVWDIVSKGF